MANIDDKLNRFKNKPKGKHRLNSVSSQELMLDAAGAGLGALGAYMLDKAFRDTPGGKGAVLSMLAGAGLGGAGAHVLQGVLPGGGDFEGSLRDKYRLLADPSMQKALNKETEKYDKRDAASGAFGRVVTRGLMGGGAAAGVELATQRHGASIVGNKLVADNVNKWTGNKLRKFFNPKLSDTLKLRNSLVNVINANAPLLDKTELSVLNNLNKTAPEFTKALKSLQLNKAQESMLSHATGLVRGFSSKGVPFTKVTVPGLAKARGKAALVVAALAGLSTGGLQTVREMVRSD